MMGKSATAAKQQKQYLDVKYTIAADGAYMPYSFSVDDEEYAIEVMRAKEIAPGKWRHSIRVKEVELYLYRQGEVWWIE